MPTNQALKLNFNLAKSQTKSFNIDMESKAKRFFKSIGMNISKLPTIHQNINMPENVEGVYKSGNINVAKNFRVSDKKAESVVMHELYHHIAKDRNISEEEQNANEI